MLRSETVVVVLSLCLVVGLANSAQAEVIVNGECHVEIAGEKLMNGPCYIVEEDFGTRRVFDNYQQTSDAISFDNFFMAFDEGSFATVYYNGGDGVTHAHALIGELPMNENGCFESENAKFCTWFYEAAD